MKDVIVTETKKPMPIASGFKLVADIFKTADTFSFIPDCDPGARGPSRLPNGQVLSLAACVLATGRPDFTDIDDFRKNTPQYYQKVLGISYMPCESMVRKRLNDLGSVLKTDSFHHFREANCRMLNTFSIEPGCLNNGMIPLDVDVSPFDNSRTHREGLGMTYKKFMGFADMFAYIGTKGFLMGAEMRPGNQHCQKDTPAFLERTIADARKITDKELLVRLDSGNDAKVNYFLMSEVENVFFLVKRNLRGQYKFEVGPALIPFATNVEKPRDGKKIYTGHVTTQLRSESQSIAVRDVFQVTVQETESNGQRHMYPEYEVDVYRTNMTEDQASDFEVIDLYHDHGTSEQFHSEIKTDMDLERFPSHKFDTNALFLQLGMLAFNALRIIEYIAREMPNNSPIHFRDTKRRRLGTIIEYIIKIPAIVTVHARQMYLKISYDNPWKSVFFYVNDRIKKPS